MRKVRIKHRSLKNSQHIKETWGQVSIFDKVYNRQHWKCLLTGEPVPKNFVSGYAHLLPKGAYPNLKEKENNIVLVQYYLHEVVDKIMDDIKKERWRDNVFISISSWFDFSSEILHRYRMSLR